MISGYLAGETSQPRQPKHAIRGRHHMVHIPERAFSSALRRLMSGSWFFYRTYLAIIMAAFGDDLQDAESRLSGGRPVTAAPPR